MSAASDAVRALIGRRGPVHWSEVVRAALYGPGGFYTSGGGAGRARDFLTGPEVGPVFGAIVARAIDAAWRECGEPDRWVVVEAGAGAGTLAASVLAAQPACSPALRYVAVEISAPLRAAAAARLPVEDPSQVLGPWRPRGEDGEDEAAAEARPGPAVGRPLVTVIEHLPAGRITGMVIANELLDNLPFDLCRRQDDGWAELLVGVAGDALVEVPVPAAAPVGARLDLLVPDAAPGSEAPWQAAAASWLRDALDLVERGRVVVVDYARATAELAALPRGEWLRTYRAGGPGQDPLSALGEQDITVDVALDQLAAVEPPAAVTDQAAWLRRHGIDELRAAAAEQWRAGAAGGGLEALKARATVADADELSAPTGLGGFTVCEWTRPGR